MFSPGAVGMNHRLVTDFLASDSEIADLIAGFDWSRTALGPLERWPTSIKTTVALIQRSPVPIVTLWGEEGIMIYNDAYSVFAGGRHPKLLGAPVRDGWPEVADFNDNVMKVGLAGGVLSYKDQVLTLFRSGAAEQVWMNLDYSPVIGESGKPIGVIAIVVETTEAVRSATELRENDRRLNFLDALGKRTATSLDADDILAVTTRMVGEYLAVTNCAYADMDDDQDGFTIRGDWAAPGSPHTLGHYRLADFGTLAVATLRGGNPLVINDSLSELAPHEASTFQRIGIGATVCMPLVKEGRLTALMAIHHKNPHVWTTSEIALMGEVTERSWAHIERVRSEAAIRANEQRFEMALSAGNSIGTWDWDVVSNRVVADARFASLYGVDPDRARAGAPVEEFFRSIHPDDVARVEAEIAKAVATGEPLASEYRLVQPNGRIRWVVAHGRCLHTPNGKPERFPGASFEITERKLAEERLRELNADLERQVVERSSERGTTWQVSPHLLSVIDLGTGNFARVNPAWSTVLGWPESELVGASFQDYLHPDDLAPSWAAFDKVMRGEPVLNFENRYRTRDGSYRWLSWVAVPENGRLFSTARDITSDKDNAAALAAAEDSLRQSQKMEAVGQLTGGIAHDFNNLLTGIGGSLQMIHTRIAQGRVDVVERYVDAAQGAVKRAAALTHRLLAFSRRQTLDPRPTNVNRLIAGMEELIRRTVGPSVHIEVVGAGGLWSTLIDPNQLENALLNLCINARDAMPQGGRLTIETANKWLDERAARERDLSPGQYISLCVTDTGTGMTPDVIAHAFDPFFTTKPFGEGTGLGLSMIYGFVRQSGGQIRIYSEPGKGTTMCLYLPRHHGDDAEAADEASLVRTHPAIGTGGGRVVMVIDDEPTIRMLIAEVLEEQGYSAIEASDGPSGMRVLESSVRIDLLITDVGLPNGMNGRQIADAARELRPALKILFITGYAENAVIGNGHLDKGMQVLTKPFEMDGLARKIRELIES